MGSTKGSRESIDLGVRSIGSHCPVEDDRSLRSVPRLGGRLDQIIVGACERDVAAQLAHLRWQPSAHRDEQLLSRGGDALQDGVDSTLPL
jgi:hypothetical protein